MKPFKYDVVKLIEGVRDRSCLWNKNIENYKDRVERRQAWVEIFNILDDRYEEMSSDDKRLTSETILSKWTNVRDTFVKSLKTKAGKARKPYVLYDNLKFLLQIIPEGERQEQDNLGYYNEDQTATKDEIEDSTSYLRKSDQEFEILFEDSDVSAAEAEVLHENRQSTSKRKRARKEPRPEVDETIDFVSVDDPRIMNEDEAFFASLLPTVVKYDEDERLEFRIEVLALMKRIKDKRRTSSPNVNGQEIMYHHSYKNLNNAQ